MATTGKGRKRHVCGKLRRYSGLVRQIGRPPIYKPGYEKAQRKHLNGRRKHRSCGQRGRGRRQAWRQTAPLRSAPPRPRRPPSGRLCSWRASERACVREGKARRAGLFAPRYLSGRGCTPMRRGLRREARERDCERIRSTCGDEREMGGGWRLAAGGWRGRRAASRAQPP